MRNDVNTDRLFTLTNISASSIKEATGVAFITFTSPPSASFMMTNLYESTANIVPEMIDKTNPSIMWLRELNIFCQKATETDSSAIRFATLKGDTTSKSSDIQT